MDLERMVVERDVRIVFYDLRRFGCEGSARKTNDDGYLVLLDIRLSQEKALEVLKHELAHIILGHLDHRSHLTYEEQEAEVSEINLWE